MLFLLKDESTNMYIGSHSARHAQLQIRDYAMEFKTEQEAHESLLLLRKLPLKLEVVMECLE